MNRIITMECPCCEQDTPHALNKSGTEYVCGFCGNAMIYHANTAARPMCAMDLRESHEARERFSDYCRETE